MSKYDNNKTALKRYTITEWVDVDTGEMLTKAEKNENYIIINTREKYEIKEKEGYRYILKTITRECRHKGQTKLEF